MTPDEHIQSDLSSWELLWQLREIQGRCQVCNHRLVPWWKRWADNRERRRRYGFR